MKLNVAELRDMVAVAVRQTVSEKKARVPKEIPMHSEESVAAQRDRQVRAMPGYAHSEANDFSRPLGPANLAKRQGASGMGGWTSESMELEADRRGGGMKNDVAGLMAFCKWTGMDDRKAREYVANWVKHNKGNMMAPTTPDEPGGETDLGHPGELGIESRIRDRIHEMQVRRLVRTIVGEELAALAKAK